MSDLRRVSVLAVLFAVLLRLCIGWQFFYEGLWKYDSLNSPKPWTSAGYLANARGPLRDRFRGMVTDPDGLGWLDYDTVDNRWVEWEKQFVKHYELSEEQQAQLKVLFDGPDEIVGTSRFPDFAEGIKIGGTLARENIIRAERDQKDKNKRFKLIVDGKKHLIPREREALLKDGKKAEGKAKAAANAAKLAEEQALAAAAAAKKSGDKAKADAETAKAARHKRAFALADRQAKLADAFNRAVEEVYKRNAKLGYREQLSGMLKGDPERVSFIRNEHAKGTVDYQRPAKTGQYIDRLKRYEEALAQAKLGFQEDHLKGEAGRIRELKAALVGPVRKLDVDLKTKAQGLLNDKQLAKGPLPQTCPFEDYSFSNIGLDNIGLKYITVEQADVVTMWALMVFGVMLIVGLFSRTTAFLGALLVFSFYLVMPPWPGVPPAPGPEHSLIVNKNLIEVAALFMLAFIPTGKWFGLDSFFVWLFPGRYVKSSSGRRRRNSSTAKPVKSTALSPAERVVKAGGDGADAEKKEPATPAPASKETYSIKSKKKKS